MQSKTKVTSNTKIIVGVAVGVLTAITLFVLYLLAFPGWGLGGEWIWMEGWGN